MKTPRENTQFHAIGEALAGLIAAAHPEAKVSVSYDERAENFAVRVRDEEYGVSVYGDNAVGALRDIGRQCLAEIR